LPLVDVVDLIRGDFVASGCPASVLYDQRTLAEHDAPPRVVFIPTTDTYEAPLAIGGLGPLNPRANFRVRQGFDAHIWGAAPEQPNANAQRRADETFLWKLVNQTVLSLHRVAPGNNIPLTGEFRGRSNMDRGLLYVLKGFVEVPVGLDIDYPPWGIDETAQTWITESGVVAAVTVDELKPDRTVLGSVSFTSGDD
jgi:hypothetical protein